MKVLIAEDDAVSRLVLRKSVEKLGHECVVTRDGLEAWEAYRNTPDVDVVISDWMMPGIEGPEFCRRVRGLDRPGYTFFIFLTALGGKEHLLEGMEAGADEYLTKPLDGDRLRAVLVSAARVTSLHRHLHAGSGQKAAGPVPRERRTGPADRRRTRGGGGKVWDVLLSQGRISEEQLQRALESQRSNGMDLGKTLVSLGYISEEDLARAQAQRLNLDYKDLEGVVVDPAALALIPEGVLRRHAALPLAVEDGEITVAISDPTNIPALEDLGLISGRRVVPVVVTGKDLQRAQNRAFAGGEGVAEILESAAEDGAEDTGEVELGAGAGEGDAPVVRLVDSILKNAVSEEASDVHVEPHAGGLDVRLRVDGVLRRAMSIPAGLRDGVIARLKVLADLDIAERRIPQDGRFSVRLGGTKVDLRVAVLPTVYGEGVVIRLLDTSSLQADLAGLGFAADDLARYREVFNRPYGTILVTGPTGSGKSTTLYATLGELNSPEKKIITVEDPVEYRLKGVNQVQVNPRAGLTFASGLRSILRNDPDVVMIGEIRDAETARTSIEAALTGHLVLATLHTNNAPGALSRLTDMGVEPFLTASAVGCVVAQRLARRLCERCKEPVEVEHGVLEEVGLPFDRLPPGGPRFYKAVGCGRCGGSGYRGRVGIYEMMLVSREIEELILRRASTGEISAAAERGGMGRLRADGLLKAARGITSIEEILRNVV